MDWAVAATANQMARLSHMWGSRLHAVRAAAVLACALVTSNAKAADIVSLDSGRPTLAVYLINGTFEGGETLKLEAIIGKLPPSVSIAVVLNSPGGSLQEGFALGKLFHDTRIPTFVLGYGGSCHSACSMAFLGGRQSDGRPSRTKMAGAQLGFHQFRQPRTAEEADKKYTKADMEQAALRTRATAMSIIQYLTDIGEDISILHLMLRAPATDINLLGSEDAPTYGINVIDERTEMMIDAAGVKARIHDR